MGVFSMSLINQMLQELDARRSDVNGAEAYGQQIRPVHQPKISRIHPAWWVTLVLAIILVVLLSWVVLRPVADLKQEGKRQLPLKLDADLAEPAVQPQRQPQPLQRHASMPVDDKPVTVSEAMAPIAPLVLSDLPAKPQKQAREKKEEKEEEKEVQVLPKLGASEAAMPDKPKLATPTSLPASPAPASVVLNKQVKELTPQQRAENEYRKSTQLLQQGKAAEAAGSLEEALQLDPLHVGARQTLIGLFLESHRQDDALRLAKDGVALDPTQPTLAMILARLQLEKGDLRTAIGTLERTLIHAADRADYHAFLAALLQRDEKHKQAAELYLKAVQRAPQNGVWWMGLGISLQAQNRKGEAYEAFKRAKSTNSLSPELLEFVETKLTQLQR